MRKDMVVSTSREVYDNIKKLFAEIKTHSRLHQLDALIEEKKLKLKVADFYKKYPLFNFSITREEIKDLKSEKILTDSGRLNAEIFSGTPLEKILAATLWKNGDLNKIEHLVDGIFGTRDSKTDHSLIFKQFGNSLANPLEPIADQHTLRAFEIGELGEFSEEAFAKLAKKRGYTKKDEALLNKYRHWFEKTLKNIRVEEQGDYKERLDKVLFIFGKEAKR